MPSFQCPAVLATVMDADSAFGYMLVPGTVWYTTGSQINDDNSTIESGRFIEPLGEVWGNANIKRQDTFLSGTAGRTGRAFSASGGGTWNSDYVIRQTQTYGLLQQSSNATSGSASVVTSVDTTDGIEHAEFQIGRGFPPFSTSIDTHDKAATYTYIELAKDSPDGRNYRIALEWGESIALDYTEDNGTTWLRVKQCRQLGNVERYLRVNDNQLRIRVTPDIENQLMVIEVGDGYWLTHAPAQKADGTALPQTGKIRVETKNGWCAFGYFPLRYQSPTVNKSSRQVDSRISAENATTLTPSREGQTHETSVEKDNRNNLSYSLTANREDAGDGLGSALPPRFSTVTIIVPSEYTFDLSGMRNIYEAPPYGYLGVQRVEELDVWDDISRTRYQSALVTCDNTYHQYSGAFGRIAIDLKANVGNGWYQRLRGYAGDGERGIEFVQHQTDGQMMLPVRDRSIAMQVPLLDSVAFDGWAWPSVVRFLATEKGNTHPIFQQYIRHYVPPGATAERPYGEAGSDFQGYVLGKGLGANAINEFGPTDNPWAILQLLASRMTETDPYTGLQAPYMMGNDQFANYHFEPIFYAERFPVAVYSEEDRGGNVFPILDMDGGLRVYNSVQSMKSDIHVQTLDARTGEILYNYLPMPAWVRRACGYSTGWLERDIAFAGAEGLAYAALSARYQAMLPTQTIRFMTWFNPALFAGQVIRVGARALRGFSNYVCTSIRSVYGMAGPRTPQTANFSLIEARLQANLVV